MNKKNRLLLNKARLKTLKRKGTSAKAQLYGRSEAELLQRAFKGLPNLVARKAKAAHSDRYILNGNTIIAIGPDDTQYTVKTLNLPPRRKIPEDKMHLCK